MHHFPNDRTTRNQMGKIEHFGADHIFTFAAPRFFLIRMFQLYYFYVISGFRCLACWILHHTLVAHRRHPLKRVLRRFYDDYGDTMCFLVSDNITQMSRVTRQALRTHRQIGIFLYANFNSETRTPIDDGLCQAYTSARLLPNTYTYSKSPHTH